MAKKAKSGAEKVALEARLRSAGLNAEQRKQTRKDLKELAGTLTEKGGGKLKTRKRKSRGKSRSTIKRKRIKKPKTKSNRKKYRQTKYKKYKRLL